jgi:hypothetical protein
MIRIAFGMCAPDEKLFRKAHPQRRNQRYVHEIVPQSTLLVRTATVLHSIERTCGFAYDPLECVTVKSIAAWRDQRLERMAMPGVLRELDLLAALLEIARTERAGFITTRHSLLSARLRSLPSVPDERPTQRFS